ncbi:uncharacterized protein [Haliotis asinina]|uniref:uncharacterized protein n=1 Tax=Haliotis asinina TaxID=109174 RepID=UPI003531A5E4
MECCFEWRKPSLSHHPYMCFSPHDPPCGPCGPCGPVINVTLRVENFLGGYNFSSSVNIVMNQQHLIVFLQKAADMREEFRFSASYGTYGYYIDTINGVEANYPKHETWWHIKNQDNVSLPLGSSCYIPSDGEIITYEFVKGAPH